MRISLAVAGFAEEDLELTVERNELHVRGQQAEDDDASYLYRGIATRLFHRTFLLADGIGVTGTRLDNGLLHIDLSRPTRPEIVKTIAIADGGEAGNGRVTVS